MSIPHQNREEEFRRMSIPHQKLGRKNSKVDYSPPEVREEDYSEG